MQTALKNPPKMTGWNLALRFVLEVVALVALGVAAWNLGAGPLGWVLAVAAPLAAAIIWGVFNVRDDPSRSGAAPVEVDGRTRLVVELAVLGAGGVAIWIAGLPVLAGGYAILVLIQYATSTARIRWLIEQ